MDARISVRATCQRSQGFRFAKLLHSAVLGRSTIPAGNSGFVAAIIDASFSDASGSLRAGRPPVTGALLKFDMLTMAGQMLKDVVSFTREELNIYAAPTAYIAVGGYAFAGRKTFRLQELPCGVGLHVRNMGAKRKI